MKLTIIGAGYVGLVSGLVFSKKGYDVFCLEKNIDLIDKINSGVSPIYEPGVQLLLEEVQSEYKFSIAENGERLIADSEIIFICVNTPYHNNGIDFTQLYAALEICGASIKRSEIYQTIVLKSTALPGTTDGIVKAELERISGKNYGSDFGIAANPEFLREGNAVSDFINADRIIIGSDQHKSIEVLKEVYTSWPCEKIIVNSSTAEFIKYYSNSFLSLLISFSNEMANVAGTNENINFKQVINAIQLDNRLSPTIEGYGRVMPGILSYLIPGPGFGGSCLPKDIKAFADFAKDSGETSEIINAVIATNEKQPLRIVSLIRRKIENATLKRYLILGVAHKPDTDDIRASIALKIINELAKESVLIVHDPVAKQKIESIFKDYNNISVTADWESSIDMVDVIVILTSWEEYKKLSVISKTGGLKEKIIVDTRYLFKQAPENVTYISL